MYNRFKKYCHDTNRPIWVCIDRCESFIKFIIKWVFTIITLGLIFTVVIILGFTLLVMIMPVICAAIIVIVMGGVIKLKDLVVNFFKGIKLCL